VVAGGVEPGELVAQGDEGIVEVDGLLAPRGLVERETGAHVPVCLLVPPVIVQEWVWGCYNGQEGAGRGSSDVFPA
jgi:hypothetical protein